MNKSPFVLVTSAAGLAATGLLVLWNTPLPSSAHRLFGLQSVVIGIGFVAIIPSLTILDYHRLDRSLLVPSIGILVLLALAAVFIPNVGVRALGASRWVRVVGQPAELIKPLFVIEMAIYLARLRPEARSGLWRGHAVPLSICLVPMMLEFLQPDVANTLVLGLAATWMLLVSGGKNARLAGAALGVVVLGLIACTEHGDTPLGMLLRPEVHRPEFPSHAWPGLLMLRDCGWLGQLLEASRTQTQPFPHYVTDFIFNRIAELYGWAGAGLILVLFLGLLLTGARIAGNAEDSFGRLLALGCTAMIVLQAFLHLAAATSLLSKATTLPLVSYGRSGALGTLVMIGLIASVGRHSARARRNGRQNDEAPEGALRENFRSLGNRASGVDDVSRLFECLKRCVTLSLSRAVNKSTTASKQQRGCSSPGTQRSIDEHIFSFVAAAA